MDSTFFHVYNHAIDNKLIFYKPCNYQHFVGLMDKYCFKYKMTVIAYCLLPNHFHLLIQTNGDFPIHRFIQSTTNSYVQALNKQLRRKGTLFQGKTKKKIVNEEVYLLHVSRYIHLNPVKHGFVRKPAEWNYSNYLDCIDIERRCEFYELHFPNPGDYENFLSFPAPSEGLNIPKVNRIVELKR